jgi:hypothetical protein
VFGTDTVSATVRDAPPAGAIDVLDAFGQGTVVGAGLQIQYGFQLTSGSHGGVTIQIESDDPARVRVAPDALSPGLPVIEVFVPDETAFASFYVQGVSPSATVTITATDVTAEPKFGGDSQVLEVVQPVLQVRDLLASREATTLSAPLVDDDFRVRTWIPNADDTALSRVQNVSAGTGPLTVTLTNDNPVFELVTTPATGQSATVQIPVNGSISASTVATGGVALSLIEPTGEGVFDTTVTATATGFLDPFLTASAPQTVTVTAPDPIDVLDAFGQGTIVGASLQIRYGFQLSVSTHGGVTVRLESTDDGAVRVAPDATTPGTGSIDVFVPDGTTFAEFYVQGVSPSATVTITATDVTAEPKFGGDSQVLEVVQPVLQVRDLIVSTTTGAADDPFRVRTWVPDVAGTALSRVQVVSAAGPIQVLLTSDSPAVGQLSTLTATGASVTVEIPVNDSLSPATLASGGAIFDAVAAGTTAVTATANGFDNSFPLASQVVNVTP